MSRTFEEIVNLYHSRRKSRSPEFAIAQDVREQYDGDVVIPLPGLDKDEKPGVANLLALGLDQTSMRIASTTPDMYWPAVKAGERYRRAADRRNRAMLYWHRKNNLEIRDARRARVFTGMATAPTNIVPDFKTNIPRWDFHDPLQTFPAPSTDLDEMVPDDVIYAFDRSLSWLKYYYPEAMDRVARRRGELEKVDEMFTLLEYIDCDVRILGVIGKKQDPLYISSSGQEWYGEECIELVNTPNKANRCTAVIPGRVSLGRRHGQFDGMLGMFQQQAMLQALSVIATKKGVFPDEWIIARANETPEIIRVANGLAGQIGVIMGGDIKVQPTDPSYQTPQMIDRLERYQRVDGGVPAQFSGENPSNVRTGRASDGTLGAQIDFTVQEAQRILARAREEENKIAVAIDRAYWNGPKQFYVSWKGEYQSDEYTPKELWVTDEHEVKYAHAGVDENGRTIEIGQLVGMGLIGKEEARRLHPLIHDPNKASDEVVAEGLEQALMAGLQSMASQPGAPVADIAAIMKMVRDEDVPLADAILEMQKKAQERQATQDAQGQPTGVDPNSPEAQPGLAAPGQGAEAGLAQVAGPSASVANLAELMARTRQPARTIAAEQNGGGA
jgi:hypothetical protein